MNAALREQCFCFWLLEYDKNRWVLRSIAVWGGRERRKMTMEAGAGSGQGSCKKCERAECHRSQPLSNLTKLICLGRLPLWMIMRQWTWNKRIDYIKDFHLRYNFSGTLAWRKERPKWKLFATNTTSQERLCLQSPLEQLIFRRSFLLFQCKFWWTMLSAATAKQRKIRTDYFCSCPRDDSHGLVKMINEETQ